MPIVNRVADLQPDIQAWRRDIHAHPELLYDVHRTAAFVADRLRDFGCDEVATGLGRTGVVGVIKGRKPAAGGADVKVVGLRADMDALPIEGFAIGPGPIMAATDAIDFRIEGQGGHAARPHICIDPVLAGAQLITALQSVVSRNVDPLESAVISVCEFVAGNARNVIPQVVELKGTVRTLKPHIRKLVEQRVHEVAAGVAQTTGTRSDVSWERGYP